MARGSGPCGPAAARCPGGAVLLSDPLASLATLPGVGEACDAARSEIDGLLWDRAIRARASEIAASSAFVGSRDSAALEGAELSLDVVRAGLDDSPVGRANAAALAVTAAVPGQVDAWLQAPLQVLAHLHVIAARGFEDEDALGRPRTTGDVIDPLHIGTPPLAGEISDRLVALADVLTQSTRAPAILVAAIAHGELLSVRPFRWGSGLIARASLRLVLASRGVDPDLLSCPEAGMLSLGRSSYVAALRDYASGEPEGVSEWIRWNAAAIGYGAQAARTT
ncbi:MAG: oxidoreductase [Candidatus Nanopelagicales bacterium]